MSEQLPASLVGLTARDVMLAAPKRLAGSATVADARAAFEDERVQVLLLADDGLFRAAVTHIPDEAAPELSAIAYGDTEVETLSPDASAETAWATTMASPHRRVVVVDQAGSLVGLLCLNETRTRFCVGRPSPVRSVAND